MKKGLRLCLSMMFFLGGVVARDSLMKKGLRPAFAVASAVAVGRERFPDEEGIKTRKKGRTTVIGSREIP